MMPIPIGQMVHRGILVLKRVKRPQRLLAPQWFGQNLRIRPQRKKRTDANDYACLYGLDKLKQFLQSARKPLSRPLLCDDGLPTGESVECLSVVTTVDSTLHPLMQ